jgi:ABC-type sugar transport system ATPase subunit
MRSTSDVRLIGVSKRYEGSTRPVIPHLDLVFPAGELAVLVGPSGCGKSTTLRIVAGLEEPSGGQVLIGGRDVTAMPPADRDIAMVFQSYALYPHMSVYENLAFALRIRRTADAEIKRRVEQVAESLGLTPYLDRRPKALSGGQRQRVAIGRAVVREPKVFLFDEPLSNLDAKLRGDMRREIARVHADSKTTSLYVTHDQVEAMTLADWIVVLKDGVVQQIAAPTEIYERPANRFVAGFFGTPSMNFLAAELASDGGALRARGPGFDLPAPGATDADPRPEQIVLGIRPEAVSLGDRAFAGGVGLPAAVAMREVLGAEVLLHLESPAGELTVRTDVGNPSRPGDQVVAMLDPTAIHWFDARSELRL